MISIKKKNPAEEAEETAKKEGIKRIAGWVDADLNDEEVTVMVSQLECKEPGCPPVECVIALLRKPKLMFKIYKKCADVTQEEVLAALKQALAEEAGGSHDHGHHEHGHDGTEAEHDHGQHGHEDGGACCDDPSHDHGHHEHGNKESSHEHEHS